MFAWSRPPMLPTTPALIDDYFARVAPGARARVLAAYPDYPRRRAAIAVGSDVMFGGPTWAFADAYSAIAPTYAYRFDHVGISLRALGLGATHGSEIVHVHHTYGSYLGRVIHPLGRRIQPSVGRRMQRAWLDFAAEVPSGDVGAPPACGGPLGRRAEGGNWPRYEVPRRTSRVIKSTRDVVVDDPDHERREAWAGLY